MSNTLTEILSRLARQIADAFYECSSFLSEMPDDPPAELPDDPPAEPDTEEQPGEECDPADEGADAEERKARLAQGVS